MVCEYCGAPPAHRYLPHPAVSVSVNINYPGRRPIQNRLPLRNRPPIQNLPQVRVPRARAPLACELCRIALQHWPGGPRALRLFFGHEWEVVHDFFAVDLHNPIFPDFFYNREYAIHQLEQVCHRLQNEMWYGDLGVEHGIPIVRAIRDLVRNMRWEWDDRR
ncbi:MAG: hypothetical protein M1829_000839 [Trizodia sp. TS-e1964]|nr:MAG: hypothetical protein M1829_000839 [Trizodia sp. TS-e1964]